MGVLRKRAPRADAGFGKALSTTSLPSPEPPATALAHSDPHTTKNFGSLQVTHVSAVLKSASLHG